MAQPAATPVTADLGVVAGDIAADTVIARVICRRYRICRTYRGRCVRCCRRVP